MAAESTIMGPHEQEFRCTRIAIMEQPDPSLASVKPTDGRRPTTHLQRNLEHPLVVDDSLLRP